MNGNNGLTATVSEPNDTSTEQHDTRRLFGTINDHLRCILDGGDIHDASAAADTPLPAETLSLLGRLAAQTGAAAKRPAEGLLSRSLSAITDAVFTLDTSGMVLFCNRAAESLTGLTSGRICGRALGEVLHLFDEKTLEQCVDIEAIAEEGKSGDRKYLLANGAGVERSVTLRCERLVLPDERVGGIFLQVRDCTRQEQLEEELLRARKLESVGLLAGGIAHDFNNILTGIITNLFMARMSVYKNEEACQLIADAEKAAFKATRLTKQLLTFSQGGAPVKESVSVPQLIEETVGFSLSGSNVDYKLDFDEEVCPVEVDKGQIDQVLNNLIINAAQAMPEGGTITISARNCRLKKGIVAGVEADPDRPVIPLSDGDYVRVSVKDEGTGIPKKHLGRIFDPYFSTKVGNTGLGLTTAYSIIRKHGGYIEVDSQPGRGTVFSFYLPALMPEKQADSPDSFGGVEACGNVLIMDDDIIIRTVVEKLLRRTGFGVVSVTNGGDALQEYKNATERDERFRFVIMDLTIPGGMGGKETVLRLKEFDPDAQVVVFSGYSNDPILNNYKDYGFDGVLKKPFSAEELMQLIKVIGSAGE